MESLFLKKTYSGVDKKVFSIALLLSVVLNFLILYSFQFYLSKKKDIQIKQPKVVYTPLVEKPPKVRKERKEKKIEKKIEKKVKQKKKEAVKTVKKKEAPKSTGKKVEKEPVIPAVTPPLPEKVELPEEKITLPEEEIPEGSFVDKPSEKIVIKEFKAVSPGKFNPSFGTALSKLDTSAKGTGKDRKVIYRPKPPVVKSNTLPPPVKVKLWINPDGTVSNVQLLETTGNPEIDKKIREYVLRWKFNKTNSSKKQWAITTIKFKIKD